MILGFIEENLENAVVAVMERAKTNGQDHTYFIDVAPIREYSLTSVEETRNYLIDKAEHFFKSQSPIQLATILDVPYASIGMVIEKAPSEDPAAFFTRSDQIPTHVAFYWQSL